MLTYTCKSCFNIFSEADKAWDKAVGSGVCPKCGKKLEDFPVTELEAMQIRKTKQEAELLTTHKHLDEVRQASVGCAKSFNLHTLQNRHCEGEARGNPCVCINTGLLRPN